MSVQHPIHLHGHDFVVLAQGSGTYTGDVTTLATPPKRDTAMLPENGYLVIAFKTDNPSAWLMYCHIGWHTEEGFIQFVERYSEIKSLIDYDDLHATAKRGMHSRMDSVWKKMIREFSL